MRHHDDHDHDDYGGLHRDLVATGALIGRRRLLRLAARFGAAAGTLQLVGCSGDSPTSPSATTTAPDATTTPTTTTPRRPVRTPAAGFPRRRPALIRATARTGRPC